jgi:hypothetical protein
VLKLKEMGLIIGCVDGPISERDISTVDTTAIPTRLATKIMMVHVVSTDGKIVLPFVHYPTDTVDGDWLEFRSLNLLDFWLLVIIH